MNVDDLLHEYSESLRSVPALDFDVLLHKAAQRRRQRLTVACVVMAAAASAQSAPLSSTARRSSLLKQIEAQARAAVFHGVRATTL